MRALIAAALLAALATAPAHAEDAWQAVDTTVPATGLPSQFWTVSAGGQRLEIHCAGSAGLMLLLFGGETRLPAAVEADSTFQLVYRLAPTGLTRSADADWLGPFDNAVNGSFPADAEFLAAFERAEAMEIFAPGSVPLARLPMSGAQWARFGFGEVCGV